MMPFHQQRIRETLHSAAKIRPQELALVLASYYTTCPFMVARQQLQELADTFSILSMAINGFVMDTDFQQREQKDSEKEREVNRKSKGPGDEALLSASQVAELLGVRKAKVYEMIKTGTLPHKNINEGRSKRPLIRIRPSDVP